MAGHLNLKAHTLFDDIGFDKSNEGGVCQGKCGRRADDKVVVFGLLKREGQVMLLLKTPKTPTPIIKVK